MSRVKTQAKLAAEGQLELVGPLLAPLPGRLFDARNAHQPDRRAPLSPCGIQVATASFVFRQCDG